MRNHLVMSLVPTALAVAVGGPSFPSDARAQTGPTSRPAAAEIVVRLDQPPRPISPDLFGVFFEDLNHAADGGLYAELIENRSFDFSARENIAWNELTGWELVQRGSGKGRVFIEDAGSIHPNNPTYAVLEVTEPGDGVGLANDGFDGVAVTAGEAYDVSLFARQLFAGRRWGGKPTEDPAVTQPRDGRRGPLTVRLETKNGEVLAEASVALPGTDWSRLTATLTPSKTAADARFVLLMHAAGGVAVDMVSLFPHQTFKGRPNGLRADLAQAIADLKPRFVRFPGGCLAHGVSLGNMYRWKDTIGPVEQRRGQPNLWGYHQTVGLGYFEYFQFCEDIGAQPLPVVAAGVSCQNSDHKGGIGQQAIPMEEMPAYVQEVLDLIEWANGPATSTWGAKRAAAGHPEPFGLKYLGVGNEDHITPAFRERFQMIYDAVRAKHPEITVIGTVGPAPRGEDFDAGWQLADELKVPVVDEHYYERPAWFLENLTRYDAYDRARSKVYLGEYASRGNALANALAEAAYMTGLERNGDIVSMASYAPLLCKAGHVQWHPDLIYFDNTTVRPSVNYYVQQLFGANAGDAYLPSTVKVEPAPRPDEPLAISSVWDRKAGEVVLKIVNVAPTPVRGRIELAGVGAVDPAGTATVLAGGPRLTNPGDPRARDNVSPEPMRPRAAAFAAGKTFAYELPASSLTVLRVKAKPASGEVAP